MINNTKKLQMKDDIMFKAFFSRPENEKFLKDFVGAILGQNVKINKVIHDARLEQITKEQKYGILDLDVELETGEFINLEMQLKNNKNMEKRTTFYASKKISEQVGIGKYYENLRKVIIIAILDYSFIELPEYITETVRVAEKHKEYKLNNEVKYYYIELEKFRKQKPDMSKKLNQWLAFIDRERGDLLEMAKKENKLIQKADETYNVLTGDAEIKRLAEIRLMSKLEEHSALTVAREEGMEKGRKKKKKKGRKEGLEKGIEKGKKEGIEKGKKEKQMEVAKKMLIKKIPIETIIELTELSKEEIENIKNQEKYNKIDKKKSGK